MATPGIYSITSKANSKVYIGSSTNMEWRWYNHQLDLRKGRHGNKHLQNHFNKYGLDDLVFDVLDVEPDQTLRLGLEQLLITALFGDGCFNQSRDAQAVMTGRKHSPETQAKMSAAHKGKTFSPEHKAKIAAAARGRTHSQETKTKVSVAQLGRTHTEETRAKMSAALKGRVFTPELRAKMCASQKARWERARAEAQTPDP